MTQEKWRDIESAPKDGAPDDGRLNALHVYGAIEFIGNDSPKCPHCGDDYDIAQAECYRLYEEGEHEVDCESCDRSFLVHTHVRFTFWTDSQE